MTITVRSRDAEEMEALEISKLAILRELGVPDPYRIRTRHREPSVSRPFERGG